MLLTLDVNPGRVRECRQCVSVAEIQRLYRQAQLEVLERRLVVAGIRTRAGLFLGRDAAEPVSKRLGGAGLGRIAKERVRVRVVDPLFQAVLAGGLVEKGWGQGVVPLTFANENGAHAGLTHAETNGFAMLPAETLLPARPRSHLRPNDLRRAGLHYLGREQLAPAAAAQPATKAPRQLRVMTYNVHSCIGMDGTVTPERIAKVIARSEPDIVALQELDVGRSRTDGLDQAELIARYLEMDYHFSSTVQIEEERYGDAILSRLPMRLIKADLLPGLASKPKLEPRAAIWVTIDCHGTAVQLINTHLGLVHAERVAQAEALLSDAWLAHERCVSPIILCGDMNARPSSKVCHLLSHRLHDVQSATADHRPRATFFGRLPVVRIDHAFVDSQFEVLTVDIPDSELARLASDHLPLAVDLQVSAAPSENGRPTTIPPLADTSPGTEAQVNLAQILLRQSRRNYL